MLLLLKVGNAFLQSDQLVQELSCPLVGLQLLLGRLLPSHSFREGSLALVSQTRDALMALRDVCYHMRCQLFHLLDDFLVETRLLLLLLLQLPTSLPMQSTLRHLFDRLKRHIEFHYSLEMTESLLREAICRLDDAQTLAALTEASLDSAHLAALVLLTSLVPNSEQRHLESSKLIEVATVLAQQRQQQLNRPSLGVLQDQAAQRAIQSFESDAPPQVRALLSGEDAELTDVPMRVRLALTGEEMTAGQLCEQLERLDASEEQIPPLWVRYVETQSLFWLLGKRPPMAAITRLERDGTDTLSCAQWVELLLLKAERLLHLQKPEEVPPCLERALALDDETDTRLRCLVLTARQKRAQGDKCEAYALLYKAMGSQVDAKNEYVRWLLVDSGEQPSLLQQAVELCREDVGLTRQLVQALLLQGEASEALRVARRHPEFPLEAAVALHQVGHFRQAQLAYERCLSQQRLRSLCHLTHIREPIPLCFLRRMFNTI